MNATKGCGKCNACKALLLLLIIATLPMHVWTCRLLMIPLPARSHVFSLVVIAESLARRGHHVTLFLGENYRLAELQNHSAIHVVRYNDMTTDGKKMHYEAFYEFYSKSAIESDSNAMHLASIYSLL